MAILLFGVLTAVGVGGFVVAVGVFLAITQNLPDPRSLNSTVLSAETVVLDRTGKIVLARLGQVHRENVDYAQIPPVLIDATTAVEDKTFWTNSGFDPLAIVSAAIDTLRGSGRGASTITQQLVRQRLLPSDLVQDPSRRAERKLLEIVQSIRLTQAFPGQDGKQQIITAYLNQNYYGNNDYGVKAAARDYFGIDDLSKLTLAQAALLASIPQSPTSYDLVRNAVQEADGRLVVPSDTAIVQRRNFVLDLMSQGRTPLTGNRYTQADFDAAKNEQVVLAPQKEDQWLAPHFVWAVKDELATRLCGTGVPTCPALERGGYQVITTLDAKLQRIAEKWVRAAAIVPHAADPAEAAKALGLTYQPWMKALRSKDVNNGALVALDYQTGEIVAYVGSADYYATKASPQFQPKFDVLADGWRQPGSAFKPFNYVTGIESHKLTAATMFMDVTTDFGGGYTPTDADNLERGPVRVRDALRFSLNIPSVKAAAVNGPDQVFATAKRLGLRFQGAATQAGLSIGLGTEELHPVDVVTGYGTLANGGRYIGHTTILRVVDANGQDVVPPYQPPTPVQAVSAQAAYIVTDILSGNTDPKQNPFWGKFHIDSADGTRRPATLKTGTNNDARDLNAYGFIAPPDDAGRQAGQYALAVGAWNGNSDNTVVSTPNNPVFSIDVTTYVWQGFMQEATSSWPIHDFSQPSGIVQKAVDPWTGLLPGHGGKTVNELFIAGTEPTSTVPQIAGTSAPASGGTSGLDTSSPGSSNGASAAPPQGSAAGTSAACGQAILDLAFESHYAAWLAADRNWMARTASGPGVAGGPQHTRTSYFYERGYQPYGASWGPLSGIGCASQASPSPSPTLAPCPSDVVLPPSPAFGATPAPVIGPDGSPCLPLPIGPSPSSSPSGSPFESPPPGSESPGPTPPPGGTPPPATPPPTPNPTPQQTPNPTPQPTAVAASPSPS